MNLTSAMYSGTVRHRRFSPIEHEFSYPVSLLYLDIDEVGEVFSGLLRSASRRPAPWWFRRRDYIGPTSLGLRAAIEARIDQEMPHGMCQRSTNTVHNRAVSGPVRLLTTVRNFGVGFNPISVYYCFRPDRQSLHTIVAEVTNTPWNRRHSYVIPVDDSAHGDSIEHRFNKRLHVSPFNPMAIEYRWRSSVPGNQAIVHLDARLTSNDVDAGAGSTAAHTQTVFFDATLNLERRTETLQQLRRSMLGQPFSSWSTVFRIYAQAYTLWRKGAPFHGNPHAPRSVESTDTSAS